MVYDHQSKSSSWTPTPRKSSFFPPSHIQTKTEATKGSELVGNLPSKAQRDKIRRSLFGDIPQMTGAKAETASQEAKAVENPTQVSEEADSGEIQAKAETGLNQSQGYGVPSREVRNKIRRSLFGNLEQTPVQKQEEGTSPPTPLLQGEGSMDDARGEEKGLAETEITLPIQAKLTIGEPNDKYEQEADRVARQVVDKIHSPTPETVQREEMGDEDEVRLKSEAGSGEKVEAGVGVTGVRMSPIEGVTINRKVNSEGETQEASVELEASIQGKRGSGQPLDESVKEPMEGAFGADFSGVRVHTDTQSDELNQAIQAKAFTTGEDIFFREGAYEPGSRGGQELLAHELTHVVQQSGGEGIQTVQPAIDTELQSKADTHLHLQDKSNFQVSKLTDWPGQNTIQRAKKGDRLNARFTDVPSGNIQPNFYKKNIFGSQFEMKAVFEPDQVDQEQGYHTVEYRQYIKGYFKDSSGIREHQLSKNKKLEQDKWNEDGNSPNGYNPYGHRYKNLARNDDNKYTDTENGSIYEGKDRPSISVNQGERVEICLDFKGELYETNHKSQIVNQNPLESRIWSVKGWGLRKKSGNEVGDLSSESHSEKSSNTKQARKIKKNGAKRTSLIETDNNQDTETLSEQNRSIQKKQSVPQVQRFSPTKIEEIEIINYKTNPKIKKNGWTSEGIDEVVTWANDSKQYRSIIENIHYNIWVQIKALYPASGKENQLPKKIKVILNRIKNAQSDRENQEILKNPQETQEIIARIEKYNNEQKDVDRGEYATEVKRNALVNHNIKKEKVQEYAKQLKMVLQESPLTQNVYAKYLPTYRGKRLLNGFEVAALKQDNQGVGNIRTSDLLKERYYAEHLAFGYPYPKGMDEPKERKPVEKDTWIKGEISDFEPNASPPTQPIVPPEFRPKYGALDYRNSGLGAAPDEKFYGTSYFVFNEAVKKRSTYTLGDSFNAICEEAGLNQKVFTYDNLDLLIIKAFYTPDGKKLISYLADRAGNSEIKELGFAELDDYKPGDQYIEAQIFGNLALDQDVKELVLSKKELIAMGISHPQEVLPKLVPILMHVSWRLIS